MLCLWDVMFHLGMMTDIGEIVMGHGMDIENHHTLVNITLQGSDQLTENHQKCNIAIPNNEVQIVVDL